MANLNPYTLAQLYDITYINSKIEALQEALEGAVVRSYDKDTTQGRQKVESAEMNRISATLQSWLDAKGILTGVIGVNRVSANFGGSRRFGL